MTDDIDPRIKYNYQPSGIGEALYGKKRKQPPAEALGLAHGFLLDWEEAAARRKKQKLGRVSKTHAKPTQPLSSRIEPILIEDDDENELLSYEPPPRRQPAPSYAEPRQSPPRPPAPERNVCNCGNPANAAAGIVQCGNGRSCKVGVYHASCVGLANRKASPLWRCRDCRPPPPPSSSQTYARPPPFGGSQDGQLYPSHEPPPAEPAPIVAAGPSEPPLHPEQERVVRCIEDGHNVFYTGSAGTGKSTVLKAFVRGLKRQGKQVDIVAPSGIAALNVGGMTIFSYAYWHPDSFKEGLDAFLKKAHGKSVRKRLCKTDVLVVDKISMVERDLLVRLDMMMREVRHGYRGDDRDGPRKKLNSPHDRKLPFGGAQLVVTGDFCQLPPVKPFKHCIQCGGSELPGWNRQDGRDMQCKSCPRVYSDADKWAFRSRTWEDCDFRYFELKQIHRQNDQHFISILQKCRIGQAPSAAEAALLTTGKADPVGAVKLLPRRVEVENENQRNFARLPGQVRGYECLDYWDWRTKDEPDLQKKGKRKYAAEPDGPLLALNDHRFEEKVQLKLGMLVILLVNLDFSAGLVNGSQGKIVRFQKYDPSQPLIEKPKYGDNPELSAMDMLREMQIRTFIERAQIQEWPVIEFANGVTRPIIAQCQLSELGSEKPYSLLGRTQIPLIAAWAITIHKSQGMTLDRVIVDLYNSFEREMVYVALSRARNLRGLKVIRLARNMGQGVNAEVHDFLQQHFGDRDAVPLHPPRKLFTMSDPWKEWRLAVTKAFADYSTMQTFPAPPAATCTKTECQTQPRLLEACPCNIRAAFTRMERSRWHPDKFARCPQKSREVFQKMASEVFVVLDGMHKEAKSKQGM